MAGIDKEVFPDSRYFQRHLPGTSQVKRLLRRGRAAHIFTDEETLLRVAQAIIERGDYISIIRNYERYGLLFSAPIGFRLSPDGSSIPLFYGEVKIDANNRYHPIPRTRPSEA